DALGIATERVHERGAALDDPWPSEVVEDLVDRALVDDIEEVRPLDEVPQRASREVEVGRDRLECSVCSTWCGGSPGLHGPIRGRKTASGDVCGATLRCP